MSTQDKCLDCGREFSDVHSHGVCFGCKIGSITFGSVPNMDLPSYAAQDKENIQDSLDAGISIGTGRQPPPKKKKPFEVSEDVKKMVHRAYAN